MIKTLKIYTSIIAFLGTGGVILHFLYYNSNPAMQEANVPIWLFYPILTGLSILLLYFVAVKATKSPKSSAKTYLIFTAAKLVISMGLLIPFILPKTENSKIIALHFFIIFLPLLLVETMGAVKLINHPFDEKNKNL